MIALSFVEDSKKREYDLMGRFGVIFNFLHYQSCVSPPERLTLPIQTVWTHYGHYGFLLPYMVIVSKLSSGSIFFESLTLLWMSNGVSLWILISSFQWRWDFQSDC